MLLSFLLNNSGLSPFLFPVSGPADPTRFINLAVLKLHATRLQVLEHFLSRLINAEGHGEKKRPYDRQGDKAQDGPISTPEEKDCPCFHNGSPSFSAYYHKDEILSISQLSRPYSRSLLHPQNVSYNEIEVPLAIGIFEGLLAEPLSPCLPHGHP